MRSPSSCRLCSKPIDVESASGLCATCLRSAETQPERSSASLGSLLMGSEHDSDSSPGDATASVEAALETATLAVREPRPQMLPPAPAGYELIRRLGSGGMGDVYLARELATNRTVAMKFLRSAHGGTGLDRFTREVRALAALDHPHIVRIITADFQRADPFFTMEVAEGGSLGKWIEKHGPLVPTAAARLLATVARAVDAAHSKNIVHRDLKPSNILLANGAKPADAHPPFAPKVSDFGLAKSLDTDDGLTATTAALGTPGFMPPEQVSRHNGVLAPAADVYGLGATLFYLLTGKPPFGPGDQAEVILQVLTAPVPRPRGLRADVPPELDGIAVKCLEKEPADRYPTAAALADDLERFLAGAKPAAPEQTPLRRARRWAVRHRLRLVSAALAVLLAAGLVAAGRSIAPSPHPDSPPPAADPLDEIRAELLAGRPVTLIGERGEPRWHRWRLGASVLRESPLADRSCSFQADYLSLLDLLPDSVVPRYRISAEVQYLAGKGPTPPQQVGPDRVGLYFGATESATPDGRPFHTMFLVSYCDVRPPAPGPGDPKYVPRVELAPVLVVSNRPDLPPRTNAAAAASVPITPPEFRGGPGKLRKIVVDATPESVLVRWRTDEGELESFVRPGPWPRHWTGDDARKRYSQLQSLLDELLRQPGLRVPEWQPRMAFGIMADRATVAFRNVVVEPLPQPHL